MPSLNDNKSVPLDLAAARQKLAESNGKTYWRSLEELAEMDGFEELLHNEFPRQAGEWTDPVSRRQFLTLMGASLALAGLSGCSAKVPEKILPYITQPEGVVLGESQYYATAMPLAGYAMGLLVETYTGRPIKIEGNPQHPACLGVASAEPKAHGPSDIYSQASILSMYDPDRQQSPTYLGKIATWDDSYAEIRREIEALGKKNNGNFAGLRILSDTISSPTLGAQLLEFRAKYPGSVWHQYEPVGCDAARESTALSFGSQLQPRYNFKNAKVILALDANFLGEGPATVRYTRDFSAHRSVEAIDKGTMNRLYAVESMLTITGSRADHRLAIRSCDIPALADTIAAKLGVAGAKEDADIRKAHGKWIDAVAEDLEANKGASLVIAGDTQPTLVHVLAHAINAKLENIGPSKTVTFSDPVVAQSENHLASLKQLVDDMHGGKVEILLILSSNPVFKAPVDFDFEKAMGKVRLRIHLSPYFTETSALCHWHLPESHFLESWSDARAYDGTASVIQPMIAPLYDGKTAHELFEGILRDTRRTGLEIVRDHWKKWFDGQSTYSDFEKFWRESLHNGVIGNTTFRPKTVDYKANAVEEARKSLPPAPPANQFELVFRADPTLFDGRFANNGWLQEMPKPITKITWDNVACISPQTAAELGVGYSIGVNGGEHGEAIADTVKLKVNGRELEMPIWIVPGHANNSITVHLGYGRTRAGRVGNGPEGKGIGFNTYRLRTSKEPWIATSVDKPQKTGNRHTLACTQGHQNIDFAKKKVDQVLEQRHLIRSESLAHYKEHPNFVQEMDHHGGGHDHGSEHKNGADHKHDEKKLEKPRPRALTLYEDKAHKDRNSTDPKYQHQWGMVVNLSACTGCNACVVACQSENNIPVVGKTEVTRGHEMHWIRIDRYFEGSYEHPNLHLQPVMCMHCENAPCETVCPVSATVHSNDGLNDMVYNRCVGTRYCSNNCPYKVRRFNFFMYSDYDTPSLKLMHNPEVTVRTRGVMEKCTFCVQRIREAEITAKVEYQRGERENDLIRDGEVVTACQSACPAQAIFFGNIRDHHSKVSQLKESKLNYGLLTELNTQPRLTYLAEIRNPNPKLEPEKHKAG